MTPRQEHRRSPEILDWGLGTGLRFVRPRAGTFLQRDANKEFHVHDSYLDNP